MKNKMADVVISGALAFLSLGGTAVTVSAATLAGPDNDGGAVYVSTNETRGNRVLVFARSADGALTPAGSFATGGLGTGGQEPDFGLGTLARWL